MDHTTGLLAFFFSGLMMLAIVSMLLGRPEITTPIVTGLIDIFKATVGKPLPPPPLPSDAKDPPTDTTE